MRETLMETDERLRATHAFEADRTRLGGVDK
jgi:hypothetical protein